MQACSAAGRGLARHQCMRQGGMKTQGGHAGAAAVRGPSGAADRCREAGRLAAVPWHTHVCGTSSPRLGLCASLPAAAVRYFKGLLVLLGEGVIHRGSYSTGSAVSMGCTWRHVVLRCPAGCVQLCLLPPLSWSSTCALRWRSRAEELCGAEGGCRVEAACCSAVHSACL